MVVTQISELIYPFEKSWEFDRTSNRIVVFQKNSLHSNFYGLSYVTEQNAHWKLPPMFDWLKLNRKNDLLNHVTNQIYFLFYYEDQGRKTQIDWVMGGSIHEVVKEIEKTPDKEYWVELAFVIFVYALDFSRFPIVDSRNIRGEIVRAKYEETEYFVQDINQCVSFYFVGEYKKVPKDVQSIYEYRCSIEYINTCFSWYEAVFGKAPTPGMVMAAYQAHFPELKVPPPKVDDEEEKNDDDNISNATTLPYTQELEEDNVDNKEDI